MDPTENTKAGSGSDPDPAFGAWRNVGAYRSACVMALLADATLGDWCVTAITERTRRMAAAWINVRYLGSMVRYGSVGA